MPNQPPTANQPFNPQQGSGFVNLSQFLNANQGNKLGSTLSNKISSSAQGVNNGLGSANQAFQNDLQSNTLNTTNNKDQATNIINEASNLNPNQGLNASDSSAFERLSSGGYNGPTGLNNATQLQNQAQQAQQYGQALGNQYGRLGLLKNLIGQGDNKYTQGDATLDNMLLGKSPELQQSQRQTRGLVNNVNNAVNLAGNQAQNVAVANKQFGNNVLGQANTAYNNYGTNLNTQAQQLAQQQAQNYQADINSLNSRQAIDAFGLGKGTATYGVNPLNYLNQYDPNQINAANVANNADVARLNALANLSQNQNTIAPQVSSNQYNPQTAINFDTSGFNNAAQAQQQQYQNVLNNTLVSYPGGSGAYGGTTSIIPYGQAPGSGSNEPLLQALPKLAAQATQAQQYIAQGGDPRQFQSSIDTYNQALAALQAIKTQYGANDTFGSKTLF